MDIRRAEPGDEPLASRTIARLKLNAPHQAQQGLRAQAMTDFLANPQNCLIVASDGSAPVGFLLAYMLDRIDSGQTMVFLYEIEVVEAYRRQGIATAMIEQLRAICLEQRAVKLWVQTTRSNPAAIALYRATGARQVSAGEEVVFAYPIKGAAPAPREQR